MQVTCLRLRLGLLLTWTIPRWAVLSTRSRASWLATLDSSTHDRGKLALQDIGEVDTLGKASDSSGHDPGRNA